MQHRHHEDSKRPSQLPDCASSFLLLANDRLPLGLSIGRAINTQPHPVAASRRSSSATREAVCAHCVQHHHDTHRNCSRTKLIRSSPVFAFVGAFGEIDKVALTALHRRCSVALRDPDLLHLILLSSTVQSVLRTSYSLTSQTRRPNALQQSQQPHSASPPPPFASLQSAPSSAFLGAAKTQRISLHNPHTTLTSQSQHQGQILPPRLAILYNQTSCLITSICVSSPPAHHVSNHACARLLLFIAAYLQWRT